MTLVDVTYGSGITDEQLRQLAQALPLAVSLAVECPEEPYDGQLQPGDVDLRFHEKGPHDSGGLEVVVEVKSRWFASRADNRQQRCERLCEAVMTASETSSVGVYLTLPIAGWAQGH